MSHFTLLSLLGIATALVHAQPATQPTSQPAAPATQAAAQRSPAELLRIPLGNVRLEKVPFQQALEWLAQNADVNVLVNWNRLATIRVRPETPVSVEGQGLTVGEFLDLLMSDVNQGKPRLGYEAGHDFVRIAPRQDLEQELVTRVYPVSDILRSYRGRPAQLFFGRVRDYVSTIDPYVAAGVAVPRPVIERAGSGIFIGGEPEVRHESIEEETQRLAAELIAAITGAVEPDSWELNGGRGTISFFNGVLIVRNSNRVHRILGGTLASGAP
jgi:hypothetical protein